MSPHKIYSNNPNSDFCILHLISWAPPHYQRTSFFVREPNLFLWWSNRRCWTFLMPLQKLHRYQKHSKYKFAILWDRRAINGQPTQKWQAERKSFWSCSEVYHTDLTISLNAPPFSHHIPLPFYTSESYITCPFYFSHFVSACIF